MTFKESIITCIQFKYADFKGRASRAEFWYFNIFTILLFQFLPIILKDILGFVTFGNILSFLSLSVILPLAAAAVRRMHDIGKSGWWVLLALIPIIGLVLIYFFCTAGNLSSNEYGAPPVT